VTTSNLFDEWTTYEKVVANDYMHHRQFFAALINEIRRRLQTPLSFVDIGCGDCASVLPLLGMVDVSNYTGIDQSETALAGARTNLDAAGVPFTLRCGGMLEELSQFDSEMNLAIASYSLHHLELWEKRQVLEACHRLLKPGGMLGVIDVFLEEGESRQSYYERWEENARRRFVVLQPAEMEDLLAHVRACDLPETLSAYNELGEAAGFEQVISVAQDPERLNRLIILTKRGDQTLSSLHHRSDKPI
jgi:ubiquinone/menaquinone biosynthesis C-methylase UbiE